MTTTTKVTDDGGRTFRIVRQKTQVTCGPACCLIMWANVFDADPKADEGGVIALSKAYPKAWNAQTGAEINNMSSVLRQMGVRTKVETFMETNPLRTALNSKVKPKKPALVFVEWDSSAAVKGHFVVVGYASMSKDKYTILDPFYGMQQIAGGLPFYLPDTDEADPPSLRFTGAVAFIE
jgi:predicted double-glycine peptidase